MQMKLLAALLALAPVLGGQTVEKVVDAYLKAKGGSKAIAQIRDSAIAGSLTEEGSGKSGSFSIITKPANRFYLEIIAGGDRAAEAYNGMSGWTQDAEGVHTLTGAAAKEAEA